MVLQFGNLFGLLAFLTLIPFIISYLIKPKPQNLKVPSLMFFFNEQNKKSKNNLFRHLEKNILFLIQLLVLFILALSVADPSFIVKKDVISDNIVFIIDASASSKTMQEGKTRFDLSKEKIKELATAKNSLILLKSTPVLLLNNADRSELIRTIERLQPTDDTSDIGGAITLAGDILGENKGRIVVLSDFVDNKGINPQLAKNVIEGKGIKVDFIDTKNGIANNIGITNMALTDNSANIYIKNYNDKNENVKLSIDKKITELMIGPGNTESLVINLQGNGTEIKIENTDDLLTDNVAYIARPFGNKIKVLLITNGDSRFVKAALDSIPDVELQITAPPVIPEKDYDVYIINQINKDKILPGSFKDIKTKIEKGKMAIVMAQPGMEKINYEGLIPQVINNTNGGIIALNYITRFTKDIDLGDVTKFYQLKNIDNELNIASVNNKSIITLYENSNGKVLYYGILESESDFTLNPNYPIFWINLLYYSVGRAELNDINLKTGSVIQYGNDNFIMDKTGYFNIGSKRVAVNLLNERESDVNYKTQEINEYTKGNLGKIKSDVDYKISLYGMIICLLLIMFEFFYIKIRGEI